MWRERADRLHRWLVARSSGVLRFLWLYLRFRYYAAILKLCIRFMNGCNAASERRRRQSDRWLQLGRRINERVFEPRFQTLKWLRDELDKGVSR